MHVTISSPACIVPLGAMLLVSSLRFASALCCSAVFRLDALALSVIATATWLAGWLAGCHTPVLYQNG